MAVPDNGKRISQVHSISATVRKGRPQRQENRNAVAKTEKRPVRFHSDWSINGWPLLDVAIGPDPARNERMGKARGIIAIGDSATGGIALGNIASGLVSVGGISTGVLSVGGLSFGGLAIGGIALGGMTVGGISLGAAAVGGIAVGYYAKGGIAVGKYVLTALHRSPQASRFFTKWMSGFMK